jgi:putative spermidine/putrescine transport system permease protein
MDAEQLEATERLGRSERALADRGEPAPRKRGEGWVTAALLAPGVLWLSFYLVAPLVMIFLVSVWTRTNSGFEESFTFANYDRLFGSNVYWSQLWDTFWHSIVIVAVCLVLSFPVAYFLAFRVTSIRNQIALFIIALAPFWTSYFIRAIAWVPLMGRNGAINKILLELGIIDEPLSILLFSDFAVVLALIQLYILFMVTPLFFMLAQVDRSALESARDLGASWWKSFREVILPQAMPGVVIGSIFVFVLTMGDYGTVRIIGGNQVSSVGLIVFNQVVAVQFPLAAASAIVLILGMMLGVFALLRFSNLREEL